MLSTVIHDWPDDEAAAILRACHRATAPGARIWLIEQVVAPGDAFDVVKLVDMLMLVLFGAQERTVALSVEVPRDVAPRPDWPGLRRDGPRC